MFCPVYNQIQLDTLKKPQQLQCIIGYCVGNLVGPQTFTVPPYTSGKLALVVCEALTLFMIAVIYVAYWIKNRIKEKKAKDIDLTKFNAIHNTEFADLTDHENPTFRYCL